MLSLHIRRLTLAAAALAALPLAAGDLTIVYKTVDNGKPGTATDYFAGGKARFGDQERETILDSATGTITTVDHEKKQYSQFTLAEMEAAMQQAAAQMESARKQQEEAMKNMPPALREKMQKMSGGGMMGSVTVVKGTGTRKIAGYDATPWNVSMGDMMKMQIWTTTAVQPSMDPGQFERLRSLMTPALKGLGNAGEEFKKIQGFSLASTATVSVLGKTMETTREATEVKTSPVDPSVFNVPAGYKKVESPFAKMGRK